MNEPDDPRLSEEQHAARISLCSDMARHMSQYADLLNKVQGQHYERLEEFKTRCGVIGHLWNDQNILGQACKYCLICGQDRPKHD